MKIGEHEVVAISNDEAKVGCQTVTRQQVQEVLRVMDEWKPASKFEVGDFVRVRPPDAVTNRMGYGCFFDGSITGRYGQIIAIDADISVEFAEPHPRLHSLGGRIKSHHGYWFRPEMLEKVD